MLPTLLLAAALSGLDSHQMKVNSFMDAERAFSTMAGKEGFRASFLHFFAPEGIGFNPQDHIVSQVLAKQEPEKTPLDYKMVWEPKFADCSAEGDLGFTTGPLEVTDLGPDKRPPAFMAYFSIWKKMPGGDLRVVFDLGTGMKGKPVFPAMAEPAVPMATPDDKAGIAKRTSAAEVEIARAVPFIGQNDPALYSRHFVAYRPGHGTPIFDLKGLREWHTAAKFETETGAIRATSFSRQADFAWSWGTFEGEMSAQPAAGYWCQVWKHEPQGWRIVADLISKLPPKP